MAGGSCKGFKETVSESLKDPMGAITEGLKESNKNLLEAEGNTDTWQSCEKWKIYLNEFNNLAEGISQQSTDSAIWLLLPMIKCKKKNQRMNCYM